jgi:hypothetical protein
MDESLGSVREEEGKVMPSPHTCRHCGDTILEDCPAHVTSCRGYADWWAKQRGDMLSEDEAKTLTLLGFFCSLNVALRDGLELIPELEP